MSACTLIDAHCHLDLEAFDGDREQVLQRARTLGVSDIIIPGTQAAYWPRISRLCENDPHLHACYGLHPYWARQHAPQDIDALAACIDDHPTVAIGECGLDFRTRQAPEKADREQQLFFFEAQLSLAQKADLPVVIHAVRATETVIQCIKKFKGISGMVHSYSGSVEQAEQLIALDFHISISAAVTYDNAKKAKQVAREIPLEYLLLETDAPDQPDEKHQGQRNEPAWITSTLEAVAALRNESKEQIARQTTENALRLFKLQD